MTLFDPEPWMDRGLCADHPDPDLWFAQPSELVARASAIRICNNCPVKAECAAHAVKTNAEFGIWGGLEPTEIRRLKRRTHR